MAKPTERPLPNNLDSERYVLGTILLDSSRFEEVSEIIGVKDFSLVKHQRIFNRMTELHEAGGKIDRVTLAEALERHKELEACDGFSYLVSLDDGLPNIENIASYCQIVKEKSALRSIIQATRSSELEAWQGEKDPAVISGELVDTLRGIERSIQPKDAALDLTEHLEREPKGIDSLFEPPEEALSTGFPRLDGLIYGLKPGRSYAVGADTSRGKSAFATQVAAYVASQGHPVLYCTLEMSRTEMWQRILCGHADVSLYRVIQGTASTTDRYRLQAAAAEAAAWPLRIDDTPGLSFHDFHSRVHRAVREYGIKLAVLDYLQILNWQEGRTRFKDIREAMMYITRSIKMTAKELGISVVVISQLSRGRARRPDKDSRPKLSDLRESSSIEADADCVILIHRKEFDNPEDSKLKGKAEVIVAKHRGGPIGVIKCHFEGSRTRFRELSDEEAGG